MSYIVPNPNTPCEAFERMSDCLAGNGRVGGVFSEVDQHFRSSCGWSFANNVSAVGRCLLFTDCSVEGFDSFDELQQVALLPGLNTSTSWVIPVQHPCLSLGAERVRIGVISCVLVGVLSVSIFGAYLFAKDADVESYNSWRKSVFFLYGCAVVISASFTMRMAWTEGVANLALLPMFALFVLGLEGLHYLPEEGPFLRKRVRAAEDVAKKVQARCLSRCPGRAGLLGVCIVHLFYGLLRVVAFPISTALACNIGIIGMIVQTLGATYEALAVQWIACLDVAATLCQGALMLGGLAGVSHYHALLPHPKRVAFLNLCFFLTLFGLAIAMLYACEPEEYLLPTSTWKEFEHCSQRIAKRAYTLAFFSMLRPVVLAVANAAASQSAEDSPTQAGESRAVPAAPPTLTPQSPSTALEMQHVTPRESVSLEQEPVVPATAVASGEAVGIAVDVTSETGAPVSAVPGHLATQHPVAESPQLATREGVSDESACGLLSQVSGDLADSRSSPSPATPDK